MQKENKKKKQSSENSVQTKKNKKSNQNTSKSKQTNAQNKPSKNKQNNKKTTSKKTDNAKNNQKKSTRYSKITPPKRNEPIKVSFLGGINEVGKNMTCYEYGKSMIIVDCGLAFPESDQLGVDFVIPDFTYVERNIDKVKGIIITHGHEDHIGALAYLLKKVNIPVYATLLTAGLINGKLSEHKLQHEVRINIVEAGDTVKLGDFDVEFIKVKEINVGVGTFNVSLVTNSTIRASEVKS